MTPQEIDAFIAAAIECSVYVAPLEPGLTYEEVLEVGKRAGLQVGEISDAVSRGDLSEFPGTRRIQPSARVTALAWQSAIFPEEPDYRDYGALDFVMTQYNEIIRSEGRNAAKLERRVIVERGASKGIQANAIEVELTILTIIGQLIDKDGVLASRYGLVADPLPGVQRRSNGLQKPRHRPMRERAYPIVKDIVGRRTDGRLTHAEPFDAFAEILTSLDLGMFRLWWVQTVSELRQSEIHTLPTAISVLSAALVEGALTFVVRHARRLNMDVFKSTEFERDPRTWKIEDLVNSAARGGAAAILHQGLLERARRLVQLRQRIHAGRMISVYPEGVPDLRPEEAREAKLTAEQVVRAVLDWLQRNPAASSR